MFPPGNTLARITGATETLRTGLMWKMTLKQRRRHREIVAELDRLKPDPYLWPPTDYEFGVDAEEDKKYEEKQAVFQALVEEMHKLENPE